MNISYITMQYPHSSETFAGRELFSLKNLGVSLNVYTMRFPSFKKNALNNCDAIEVHRPGIISFFYYLFVSSFQSSAVSSLLFSIIKEKGLGNFEKIKCIFFLPRAYIISNSIAYRKPDVLHVFWGHYPALVLCMLDKDILNRTVLSLFLGAYDLEKKLPVSRWAAKRCDLIFTHANANVPVISDLLGKNINVNVVHRGIDLSDYPSKDELEKINKSKTIFTAGRLIKNKGFEHVINVFESAKREQPDIILKIAGDGPDRKRLISLVEAKGLSDSVEFLGWLDEESVRNEMLSAKVFLFLSSKPGERLPNVIKEAMACGCVCVVSHSPGIEELIEDNVDGYIVDGFSIQSITALVCRHLCVASLEAIQIEANKKIFARFDVKRSAEKYYQLWMDKLMQKTA